MKNQLMKDMKEELLMKFLSGDCSEEEALEVKNWLEQSEEHARELFELEEIYHLSKATACLSEKELNRAEAALFQRLQQEELPRKKVRSLYQWLQYAAVLVGVCFLVGMGNWLYQERFGEGALLAIDTQDSMKKVVLPDGTKVWLNRHTVFRYPQQFDEDLRKVYLDGEGYFEVSKNPSKPFIVQSQAMQVRVLGTVFNLKSDEKNLSAVATLMQGEIEVKGNHEEGMVVLAPGQQAELDVSSKRLVVRQIDTGIDNWHNQTFSFENADVFTIARTLEKFYGVKIILSADLNTEKTYSGVLKKSERLEKVLELVKLVIPMEYTIRDKCVYLSASKQ